MVENTQQSIWNFDGAELYAVFEIKRKFMEYLDSWDLENAYWQLRSLRREIDAKLKRAQKKMVEEFEKEKNKGHKEKTEKAIIDELINDLDNARKEYIASNLDETEKSNFYLKLEAGYMELCYTMKKHGLYFREGDDTSLAVLRR